MVNTRNRVAADNVENNGESNNQEANLPPPPLLTLEQVLAMQAKMVDSLKYHIYIFPRDDGSVSCLRLTQGVTPMSTIRLSHHTLTRLHTLVLQVLWVS
jgi:hypothetical protein